MAVHTLTKEGPNDLDLANIMTWFQRVKQMHDFPQWNKGIKPWPGRCNDLVEKWKQINDQSTLTHGLDLSTEI